MKADTSEPCDLCEMYTAVARICVVTGQGELVDYTDLCPLCLKDAAKEAGLTLGAKLLCMKGQLAPGSCPVPEK